MQDFINKHLANGLQAFQGATVTGNVPIRQEAINELIAEFLQPPAATSTEEAPDAASADSVTPPPPRLDLRKFVKHVAVQAQDGKLTVSFELRVD
jgi:hypothetical protein